MTSSYDINLIPLFPKDFSKESEEIKDLIIYLNEINISVDSINKLCKAILKVNDQFYNEILSTLKNLNSDFMTYGREIESLISDIILVFCKGFINLMEKSSECFKELNFDEIIKKCLEPSENISNKINNLNEKCIILSNQRIQYKNFENQENELLKRLENSYQKYINLGKKGKNVYDFGLRETITNSLYENDKFYEDNKKERMKIYSDCQNLELQINIEMKEFFIYIINIYLRKIKTFVEKIDSSMNFYNKKINEILNHNIVQLIESLNVFNDRKEVQTKEFNLEKEWTKSNFISSEIPKEFNEITQKHLNKVSYEKKILQIFLSSFKNLITINENFNSSLNKELKNVSNLLKLQSSIQNSFLIQLINFLNNLFDLHLKKNIERIKKINNNLISPLSNYNETLSNIENKLSDKLNKFNKEYSNFKSSNHQILGEKEKLDNEFNKMKESLEKDPSKFSEFEKTFLSIKSEIDKYQEKLNESYIKSKPLINEYNENVIKQLINKTLNVGKTKIENIINNCFEYISNEKKIFELFEGNYTNKYIFVQDKKTSVNNYITELFKLFSKKHSITFPEEFYNTNEKKINDLESVYLFNTEETIINNYLNISNSIPQSELIRLKEEIDLVTSKNMEINYKNVIKCKNKVQLYEDIFIIETDEKILEKFSCTLKIKNTLQGTLYLTNKKLVFYSSFNISSPSSKTLIIIPNIDVLFINKKDNSIELKAENETFLFGSLLYPDSCYELMEKTFFNEYSNLKANKKETEMNNNILKTNSLKKPKIKNKFSFEEIKLPNIKSYTNLKIKKFKDDLQKNNKDIPKYIEEIKNINKINLNNFLKNNKRDLIEDFEYNLDCGNLSLPIIFNLLYNHNINLPFFENKSYLVKLAEQRQDYYLDLIHRGNYENIPKYYKTNSIEDLKNYKMENLKNQNLNHKITYKTKYIHPILKKRFGGPSKLEVEEETNIFIISPFCFIVEISSYLSGFMLVDTYFSIVRYIYTTKISEKNSSFSFKTKLKINLSIEFIKETWFKSKIKSDGISDSHELIKDVFLPLVKKIFENTNNNKDEICKYLFSNNKNFQFIRINSLQRKRSISINEYNNVENNNLNEKDNKNEYIIFDEYMKKIKNYIQNLDFETYLIIGACIFVFLLFLIFKFDIAVIILIFIAGFSFLFYKINDIDNDINVLKREINLLKKNKEKNENKDKKE